MVAGSYGANSRKGAGCIFSAIAFCLLHTSFILARWQRMSILMTVDVCQGDCECVFATVAVLGEVCYVLFTPGIVYVSMTPFSVC